MIHFPYGISDFHALRTEGFLYLDRTAAIPVLEAAGKQLIFLRPRRFGKSLLLSTLANYYDINKADQFDALFGGLSVGNHPTPERNSYLILRWDFSTVSAQGDIEQIRQNLFDHLNDRIRGFLDHYHPQLPNPNVVLNLDNALSSLEQLLEALKNNGQKLYLLIDEYDNFANEVLVRDVHNAQRYRDLLEGEGILKTLFKVIKASASEGKIARVFITGVSPLVLSDATSGYNVATDISQEEDFNTLCGIAPAELSTLVEQIIHECAQPEHHKADILATMREFYNGYRFCSNTALPTLYNPILCFHFLRHYQRYCSAPRQMLDGNLAMDAARIRYIASQPSGLRVIESILNEEHPVLLDFLENRFGVEKLGELQHDERYMLSLLYYFGVLTITGTGELGKLALGIPNLVTRALYVDELKQRVLPAAQERIDQRHREPGFDRLVWQECC
ncbi:AAA family ATPase [Thiothrix lacustris]|uniref:AAA family ATPase n=1 Tax=Thiothrix lacustris TaxID=525917 RepID=A0ABY9MTE7_9GAMM|nr:AAA family ATPase [Thiothrix lacustris]WML91717.1 AAA family ATPase [Thiothrix lacustris]WMP16424.1 AAA family ATPase [Thiothrix lacustris]